MAITGTLIICVAGLFFLAIVLVGIWLMASKNRTSRG
jgi:hypothetical protein